MTRFTRSIRFAIAGLALLVAQPAFAQRTDKPGPPPFVVTGPPQIRLASVLYTSPLEGLWYTCNVLNTTAAPLDVSIVLVKESSEEYAAADFTIPPREVRSIGVNPESILGYPIQHFVYCRISFQGEKDAVRGVLQTHVGELILPLGERQHRQGSTSSEAR